MVGLAAHFIHAAGVGVGVGAQHQQHGLTLCFGQLMQRGDGLADLDQCLGAVLDGDLVEIALDDRSAIGSDQVRGHLHRRIDAAA
ncbi:hypothetical protein D9M69_731110 [compost metagenome]